MAQEDRTMAQLQVVEVIMVQTVITIEPLAPTQVGVGIHLHLKTVFPVGLPDQVQDMEDQVQDHAGVDSANN